MSGEQRFGRAETVLNLFPVADLTLPGTEPQPGVAYGRTETVLQLHPVETLPLTAPLALQLALRLGPGADPAAAAVDVLTLAGELHDRERAIGGTGLRWTADRDRADALTIRVTLIPTNPVGAAGRLEKLAEAIAACDSDALKRTASFTGCEATVSAA
jgi:hypothetical protein